MRKLKDRVASKRIGFAGTVRSAALTFAAVAGLVPATMLWADTSCAAPPELRARLAGTPDASAYNDLGIWFAGKEQYACSAEALATSLQMEPQQKDVAHIAFMFGVSLYFSGQTKDAISALQQVEQMGYRDTRLHLVLASAFDSIQSSANAEAEWRQALEQDWESPAALDGLSSDLNSDGNFAATIALLEDPKVQSQRTATQSLNLGIGYEKTGKLAEAAVALQDGLNTTPESLALANALAGVLVQLKRTGEAEATLRLAIEGHPDNAQEHARLGVLLAQGKRFAEAKVELEKAISLGDASSETTENLARVMQALDAKK
jgi:Flp pilus assembly protein TadD